MNKKIDKKQCSICESSKLNNILSIKNVPIATYTVENVEDYLFEDYNIVMCEECNTFQLKYLIDPNILYNGKHHSVIIGETWKKHFEEFGKFIKKYSTKNNNFLEFGDPDQKTCRQFNISEYNKWYIIDPCIINNKHDEKIILIKDFFDDSFDFNKFNIQSIDLIVHSHFFEHLYNPTLFLNKMYDILNDDGLMIFSIPNMSYLANLHEHPTMGLFFEHHYFLCIENLNYILTKCGFNILNIQYYKNHSIFISCKKIVKKKINKIIINYKKEDILSCFNKFNIFIKKISNILDNYNGVVYLYGASDVTKVLISLGMNKYINNITGILDNNKYRHDKYLYGTKLKVFSPNIIKNINNCIIIGSLNVYSSEIKDQLYSINKKCIIHFL